MATDITSEMTASVWRILVAAGDRVAAGDTVVILEAMKMEIPVDAPAAGTVTSISVAEGDVVQEGQVIAVLEGEPG